MAGAAEGIGTIGLLIGTVCYFSGAFHGVGANLVRDVNDHRPTTSISVDRTAASNSEREALIDRFIADGVLTSVVMSGTTPEAFTGPSWSGLSFNIQQSVMAQVALHYADVSNGLVYLREGRSKAPLGTFSLQAGGVLNLN